MQENNVSNLNPRVMARMEEMKRIRGYGTFNPSVFAEVGVDAETGNKFVYMPLGVLRIWFRQLYPNGKICQTTETSCLCQESKRTIMLSKGKTEIYKEENMLLAAAEASMPWQIVEGQPMNDSIIETVLFCSLRSAFKNAGFQVLSEDMPTDRIAEEGLSMTDKAKGTPPTPPTDNKTEESKKQSENKKEEVAENKEEEASSAIKAAIENTQKAFEPKPTAPSPERTGADKGTELMLTDIYDISISDALATHVRWEGKERGTVGDLVKTDEGRGLVAYIAERMAENKVKKNAVRGAIACMKAVQAGYVPTVCEDDGSSF